MTRALTLASIALVALAYLVIAITIAALLRAPRKDRP